ncbi:MAG: methyltransferase domain-containing protein [Candidatus Bathyarchaeia archaeon]
MLVERRRSRLFYRYFSAVFDSINPFFYNDRMRRILLDRARISKGDLILDIGSGTAYTTLAASKRSEAMVVGIDLSPEMLKRARRKSEGVDPPPLLALSNAYHLPFRSSVFEAVISAGAIEYWRETRPIFAGMRRVMRRGGRLSILGPREPTTPILRQLSSMLLRFVVEDQIVSLLRDAGFREVESVSVGPRMVMEKLAVVCSGLK